MWSHKPITYPNVKNLRIRSRRGMLHFELDGGIYFVTFRLADSLPREAVLNLVEERERTLRAISRGRTVDPLMHLRVAAMIGEKFEAALDEHRGECLLRDPRAATVVDGAIRYFHEKRYTLIGWSVMPSHVHVVMHLDVGADLGRVLHSWKSYSSKVINRALGRTGRVWQREYFDRVVRDERELGNVVEYTVNNPEKAGLVGWPFVGLFPWE